MIDRTFARQLWNRTTILGIIFIAAAPALIAAHYIILGPQNNLGFGPFAAAALLAGIVLLAAGCTRALRAPKEQPPD